jgi:hypothetical protein
MAGLCAIFGRRSAMNRSAERVAVQGRESELHRENGDQRFRWRAVTDNSACSHHVFVMFFSLPV